MSLVTAGTVVATSDLLGNYFSQTGEEVPIGTTIGPVRGLMTLAPTTSTTVNLDWRAELAMQLLPEGGRATLPSPGVDIIDAMWYGQAWANGILTEKSAGVFVGQSQGFDFQTKAMRKVTGNGQELTIFGVSSAVEDYDLTWIGVLMLMLP